MRSNHRRPARRHDICVDRRRALIRIGATVDNSEDTNECPACGRPFETVEISDGPARRRVTHRHVYSADIRIKRALSRTIVEVLRVLVADCEFVLDCSAASVFSIFDGAPQNRPIAAGRTVEVTAPIDRFPKFDGLSNLVGQMDECDAEIRIDQGGSEVYVCKGRGVVPETEPTFGPNGAILSATVRFIGPDDRWEIIQTG